MIPLYGSHSSPILHGMKCVAQVFAVAAVVAGFAYPQVDSGKSRPVTQSDDKAAIRTIVSHWQQSWENFDPSVLQGDYADDADWLNAFGVRIKGGAKIVDFVSMVMKRSTVQGRHTTWGEPSIRFVRPDVALAYRDYKTVGQRTADGVEMPERSTHSTWLLTKENGRWRITSQVISDDNNAGVATAK